MAPDLDAPIRAGRLTKVEVLAGSFRLRRADLEQLALGHQTEAVR